MLFEVHKKKISWKLYIVSFFVCALFFVFVTPSFAQPEELVVLNAEQLAAQRAETLGIDAVGDNIALGDTDIRVTVAKVIRAVLGLLGIIAVVIVMYGGFLWMTAGGNADQITKAKQWLINGAIGLAIILSAFAIVSFVLSRLAGATGLGGGGDGEFCLVEPCNDRLPPPGCVRFPCDGGAFVVKMTPTVDVEAQNVVVKMFFQNNGEPAAYDKASVHFNGEEQNIKIFNTNGEEDIPIPFLGDDSRGTAIFLHPSLSNCPIPGPAQKCFNRLQDYRVEVSNIKLAGSNKTLKCDGGLGFPAAFDCEVNFGSGDVYDDHNNGGDPTIQILNPHAGDGVPIGKDYNIQVRATDDHGLSAIRYFTNGQVIYESVFGGDQKIISEDFNWFVDSTKYAAGVPITILVDAWDVDGNNKTAQVVIAPRDPECFNNVMDGNETGVDIGGRCGGDEDDDCNVDTDCASGVCDEETHKCVNVPRIDWVSPESSAPSTYVTIGGRFFGAAQLDSKVCLLSDPDAQDCTGQIEVNIPQACGPNAWSDKQVVIEVPEADALVGVGDTVSALRLGGVNEYAHISSDDSEGLNVEGVAITLEAFVTYEGTASHGGKMFVISRGATADSPHYGLYVTKDGNLGFQIGTVAGLIDQVSKQRIPNDGNLHHIVATYNGNDIRSYIDGVLAKQNQRKTKIVGGDFETAVGAFASGKSGYFKGIIHSVAIWDKFITEAEVLAHSTTGIPLVEPNNGQQAHWRFVSTMRDRTRNANNLTGKNIEPANYVEQVSSIGGEEGIRRLPILLERNINNTFRGDKTNDEARGRFMPEVLTIDDVDRPSLCVLDPDEGKFETLVNITGKKFGNTQEGRAIFFGETANAHEPPWTDELLTTKVPNLGSGSVSVYVKDGEVQSNSMEFTVNLLSADERPFLEGVDPAEGPVGQYITLNGSNLGNNPEGHGRVIFVVNDPAVQAQLAAANPPIENEFFADVDFPQQCNDGNWLDQSIVVKVPAALESYVPDGGFNASIFARLTSGPPPISTNAVDFKVTKGEPSPGICKIDPSNGPLGTQVNLYGERLTVGEENKVFFWGGGGDNAGAGDDPNYIETNPAATTWNADADGRQIITSVPGDGPGPNPDAKTGPVFGVKDGQESNSVLFNLYNCVANENICPEEIGGGFCCTEGRKTGSCVAEQSDCADEVFKSEFAWRYSTGKIPIAPKVLQQCGIIDKRVIPPQYYAPSPTPWENWNNGEAACVNAEVAIIFDKNIDEAGLVDSVILEKCKKIDGTGNCSEYEETDYVPDLDPNGGTRIIFEDRNGLRQDLEVSSLYRVRVLAGLRSLGTEEKLPAAMSESSIFSAICGAGTAYCFEFLTAETNEECVVKHVAVSPPDYTALGFGVITNNPNPLNAVVDPGANWQNTLNPLYTSTALAGNVCISVGGQDWNWSSTDVSKALITGIRDFDPQDDKGDSKRFVETREQTKGTPIKINAQIANSNDPNHKGYGNLEVDLPDPKILSAWPICDVACVNTEIAFITNQEVVVPNWSVQINKCTDSTCARTVAVGFPDIVQSDANTNDNIVNDKRKVELRSRRWWINGAWVINRNLDPNSFYKVLISKGRVATPAGVTLADVGPSEWDMDGGRFYQGWYFRTKEDGSACGISDVVVNPQELITSVVGEITSPSLNVFGPQDGCGPDGRARLDSTEYDWDWYVKYDVGENQGDKSTKDSADFSGNRIAKISNFDLGGDLPLRCSLDCRLVGSDEQGPISTCGDGLVDQAEECDPADPATALNCSGNCLLKGNRTTCGSDGRINIIAGENCDDGNNISGDGCSNVCLREGSGTIKDPQRGASVCGNGGSPEADETCDDGKQCDDGTQCTSDSQCEERGAGTCLPRDFDGCSAKCLKEGTRPAEYWCAQANGNKTNYDIYSACSAALSVCGNNIQEDGEACDDGLNCADDSACTQDADCAALDGEDKTCKPRSGDKCSQFCLNEGTTPVLPDGGLCGNTINIANPIINPGEDCDDGMQCSDGTSCDEENDCLIVPNEDKTCRPRDGDGCSARCLIEGSSAGYPVPSFCGDAVVGGGEQCEAASGGDGKVDATQFAIAIGRGVPDAVSKQQVTNIFVEEVSTPYAGVAEGKFVLQCGFSLDKACPVDPNINGVGYNTCCAPRPVLGVAVPNGVGTCRNTAIKVEIDQDVDLTTLANNLQVLRQRDGACDNESNEAAVNVSGHELAYLDVNAEKQGLFKRAWKKTKRFIARITGDRVFAISYCSGDVFGDPYFTTEGDQRYIGFELKDALGSDEDEVTYVVLIKGGQQGLRSKNGVALLENQYWNFTTEAGPLCKLDVVKVEPASWTFTSTLPGNDVSLGTGQLCTSDAQCGGGNGSCAPVEGDVKRCRLDKRSFEVKSYKQIAVDNLVPITPIPGNYDWDYTWNPADANSNQVIAVNLVDGVDDSVLVNAKINGQTPLLSTAKIIAGPIGELDREVQGNSKIEVFLCDNPWPKLEGVAAAGDPIFPYEDISGTNDNILEIDPTLREDGADVDEDLFYGHFSVHYCMDAGSSGTQDDMPALVDKITNAPTVLYATQAEYDEGRKFGGGLLKQFHFINPGRADGSGANDIIGIRVHRNDKLLSLSQWYSQERPFDPTGIVPGMSVDGYPAARVGNTVYVNVADKLFDDTLSSKIFVISVGAAPGKALHSDTQNIFDQLLANIRFNINIESFNYCAEAGAELPSADADACSSNFDCRFDEICLATRDKLRRDWDRVFDLKQMTTTLSEHYRISQKNDQLDSGSFPNLQETSSEFGSFLPFMTNSTWNSWQGALGNTVAASMPVDPINRFTVSPTFSADPEPIANLDNRCGSRCNIHTNLTCSTGADCPTGETCLPDNNFDPQICWNGALQQFMCPKDSQVYRYQSDFRGSYARLGLAFELNEHNLHWPLIETGGDTWREENDWLGSTKVQWNLDDVCEAGDNPASTYGIEGSCGDGVVNVSATPAEACEPGMVQYSGNCTVPGGSRIEAEDKFVARVLDDGTVVSQGNDAGRGGDPTSLTYQFTLAAGDHTLWVETYSPQDLSNHGNNPANLDRGCENIPGVQFHLKAYVARSDTPAVRDYLGELCVDAMPLEEGKGNLAIFNVGQKTQGNYNVIVEWDNDWNARGGADVADSNLHVKQVGFYGKKAQMCTISCQWGVGGDAVCLPQGSCGDGVKQLFETCDSAGGNGLYGGFCNEMCSGRSAFCGDDQLDAQEVCDPTVGTTEGYCSNDTRIRCINNNGCNGGGECKFFGLNVYGEDPAHVANPARAIDPLVARANSCRSDCAAYGPYCGDGHKDEPYEQCDGTDGVGDALGCDQNCRLLAAPNPPDCGNNIKETGEECDPGGKNGAPRGPADCSLDCKILPACGRDSAADDDNGDGVPELIPVGAAGAAEAYKDPGEVCDDGPNNGLVPQECPWGQLCTYCAADCSEVLSGSVGFCEGVPDGQEEILCLRNGDCGAQGPCVNSPAFCGNGKLDDGSPELCDWGVGSCQGRPAWSCSSDSDCLDGVVSRGPCINRAGSWAEYMARENAIAVGMDEPTDHSQDQWCIDVKSGYIDYPARCNPDCSGFSCIQRAPSGEFREEVGDLLCNENADCSRVSFTFDDGSGRACADDIYQVILKDEATGKEVNLAQNRIDFAKSQGRSQKQAEQWGYWGVEWDTTLTDAMKANGQEPEDFEFTRNISQSLSLNHLPVSRYKLIVNSIYSGGGGANFRVRTSEVSGQYNIDPLEDVNPYTCSGASICSNLVCENDSSIVCTTATAATVCGAGNRCANLVCTDDSDCAGANTCNFLTRSNRATCDGNDINSCGFRCYLNWEVKCNGYNDATSCANYSDNRCRPAGECTNRVDIPGFLDTHDHEPELSKGVIPFSGGTSASYFYGFEVCHVTGFCKPAGAAQPPPGAERCQSDLPDRSGRYGCAVGEVCEIDALDTPPGHARTNNNRGATFGAFDSNKYQFPLLYRLACNSDDGGLINMPSPAACIDGDPPDFRYGDIAAYSKGVCKNAGGETIEPIRACILDGDCGGGGRTCGDKYSNGGQAVYQFSVVSVARCGNSIVESWEECDEGPDNGSPTCNDFCDIP